MSLGSEPPLVLEALHIDFRIGLRAGPRLPIPCHRHDRFDHGEDVGSQRIDVAAVTGESEQPVGVLDRRARVSEI
jgi:hypothetical protein